MSSIIPRNPSAEFIRLNPHLFGAAQGLVHSSKTVLPTGDVKKLTPRPMVIRLRGQVRGGKNAMGVTKSGRHYARPAFKKWRADMVAQINGQDAGGVLISEPTNVRIDYVAGDRKRRDQTGIFDALFHLLEYAQVVTDDSLLWVTESTRRYDKSAPGVTITFCEINSW